MRPKQVRSSIGLWGVGNRLAYLTATVGDEAADEPTFWNEGIESMRVLSRVSWLLPLLCAGAIPGSTSACGGINEPSCAAKGEKCGFFIGSCCAGLQCSEGECLNLASQLDARAATAIPGGGATLDARMAGAP